MIFNDKWRFFPFRTAPDRTPVFMNTFFLQNRWLLQAGSAVPKHTFSTPFTLTLTAKWYKSQSYSKHYTVSRRCMDYMIAQEHQQYLNNWHLQCLSGTTHGLSWSIHLPRWIQVKESRQWHINGRPCNCTVSYPTSSISNRQPQEQNVFGPMTAAVGLCTAVRGPKDFCLLVFRLS